MATLKVGEPSAGPVFVSTWKFGKAVNDRALEIACAGGELLDAIVQGIAVAEADPENHSVGLGGIPNAEGVVQLDACLMYGPGHRAGSVAGLEGILHPIAVARLVMEKTPHVMLVGQGARQLALQHGFPSTNLLLEEQRQKWEQWKREQSQRQISPNPQNTGPQDTHDTMTLVGMDRSGALAGGCSTSGWRYKLPGRVGDSPIIGSGLYVDEEVGAGGATGAGENVMRYCAAFLVVELMRQGAEPAEACRTAIRRIAGQDPKGFDLDINLIALDKRGRFGAAGTRREFPFCAASPAGSEVLQAEVVDRA